MVDAMKACTISTFDLFVLQSSNKDVSNTAYLIVSHDCLTFRKQLFAAVFHGGMTSPAGAMPTMAKSKGKKPVRDHAEPSVQGEREREKR